MNSWAEKILANLYQRCLSLANNDKLRNNDQRKWERNWAKINQYLRFQFSLRDRLFLLESRALEIGYLLIDNYGALRPACLIGAKVDRRG